MKKIMLQKIFLAILPAIIGFAFSPLPAYSQSITTIQDIDFGQGVVKNNDAQYSIELSADGSYSVDPEIVFTTFPDNGEYLATDLPPSTPIISVTVTVTQQMLGDGEDFIIDNFDIDHPASSDINGELPILLGARLSTTGSSTNYTGNTTFNSSMILTVNY